MPVVPRPHTPGNDLPWRESVATDERMFGGGVSTCHSASTNRHCPSEPHEDELELTSGSNRLRRRRLAQSQRHDWYSVPVEKETFVQFGESCTQSGVAAGGRMQILGLSLYGEDLICSFTGMLAQHAETTARTLTHSGEREASEWMFRDGAQCVGAVLGTGLLRCTTLVPVSFEVVGSADITQVQHG